MHATLKAMLAQKARDTSDGENPQSVNEVINRLLCQALGVQYNDYPVPRDVRGRKPKVASLKAKSKNDTEGVPVGTALAGGPRTDPYVRNYRIRLPPRVDGGEAAEATSRTRSTRDNAWIRL